MSSKKTWVFAKTWKSIVECKQIGNLMTLENPITGKTVIYMPGSEATYTGEKKQSYQRNDLFFNQTSSLREEKGSYFSASLRN